MKTLIALATAIRNLWLLCLVLVLVVFIDPGWGLYDGAVRVAGSPEVLLRAAVVLAVSGVLWEHFLGALTRKRQAALARALLRLQPGLQHVGAIRILIQAMATSDPALTETIHKDLVKLTGKDFGSDPIPWKQWLERQERISAGKKESITDLPTPSLRSETSLDQETRR
ncbi:MAG: hypothetical protein VX764_04345 [Planctomycetota bacterium]|nr:hypothetical protein [Planctomycetota bacterium]